MTPSLRPLSYDLVLLDRDGVLNQDLTDSVRSLEDFRLLPNAMKAVAYLSEKGLKIALVTNQAVVGRGELSYRGLEEIHEKLVDAIHQAGGHLDHLYICTDVKIPPHNRRKPAPGMILEALEDFTVDPLRVLMIGDSLIDLQAAKAAGVKSALVRTGKGKLTERELVVTDKKGLDPIGIYDDLYEAVVTIFP